MCLNSWCSSIEFRTFEHNVKKKTTHKRRWEMIDRVKQKTFWNNISNNCHRAVSSSVCLTLLLHRIVIFAKNERLSWSNLQQIWLPTWKKSKIQYPYCTFLACSMGEITAQRLTKCTTKGTMAFHQEAQTILMCCITFWIIPHSSIERWII